MSAGFRILSGSRAGASEQFTKSVIAIGRHPLCDLRFDAQRDLDVSARHAEIRVVNDEYVLHDTASRNGTFVNGSRISGPTALKSGDVISLGELGPRLEFTPLQGQPLGQPVGQSSGQPPAPPARSGTTERIAAAVDERTRGLRRAVTALTIILVAALLGAWWLGQRGARTHAEDLLVLSRTNDSLARVYGQRVASLSGKVAGLDSSLAAAKVDADAMRHQLADATHPASSDSLERALRALESRRHAMLTAAEVDYASIASRNGAAIVLIAVQWPDGQAFSGSGFCVQSGGAILTNRHLVRRNGTDGPTRIAVIFSDTKQWLPAHLVRVDSTADLAEIHLDADGHYPIVSGLVQHTDTIPVGRSVAIIGYPLGTDTPMEGSGMHITARSSLSAGTVSKNLRTVLQVDAYAGEGSSGSPVFDAKGHVIGVVYGAARDSQGRIVYAVPGSAVAAFLAL